MLMKKKAWLTYAYSTMLTGMALCAFSSAASPLCLRRLCWRAGCVETGVQQSPAWEGQLCWEGKWKSRPQ
jgi:hypothetical protein